MRIIIGDFVIDRHGHKAVLTKKIGNICESVEAFDTYDQAIDKLLIERKKHITSDQYQNTINRGLEALSARWKVKRLLSRRAEALKV